MDALRILALGVIAQLPNTPSVDLQTILPQIPNINPDSSSSLVSWQPRLQQNQGRDSNLSADLFRVLTTEHS